MLKRNNETRLSFGFFRILLALCSATLNAGESDKGSLKITVDHPDARYELNDTVTFNAVLEPAQNVELSYTIKENYSRIIKSGKLSFKDGKASVSAKFENPGFMFLQIKRPQGLTFDRFHDGYGGASCHPEKLEPSTPEPEDFVAFWEGKKKIVENINFGAKLDAVKEYTDDQIETFAITLNSINGTKARGFYARPRAAGKYPAIILLHGAGVYAINGKSVSDWARKGVIAIDINAHDLPNDKPKEFYEELKKGKLKGYSHFGRDDREKFYFLRMFSSCYQAARYITSRKEWDGIHFVSSGSSQGGAQSFATAFLCYKVSAFFANVPAMCDHTGPSVGRGAGWPRMITYNNDGTCNKKQFNTSLYYDCANFARHIKANALVSCGFVDRTCIPSSVYTAFNQLTGEKRMFEMIETGHEIPKSVRAESGSFIRRELGLPAE